MIKAFAIFATIFLSGGVAEEFLPDMGEKLTIIAALAFFLYYFMKELKELRNQHETTRLEHEKKMEAMFERMASVEQISRQQLERSSEAMESLREAVIKLTATLNRSS